MSRIEEMVKELCPKGVERVKLIDAASVLYGFPFDASHFSEDSKFIPLIRIRDVLTGEPCTFYEGTYDEQYIIQKGDILVGMDGNFNVGKWNSCNGLLCQRTCKIQSIDEEIVLNNFLYHLLVPLFKKIEQKTPSGSVKHLSAQTINNIRIPLPPLSVQREIVSVLDSFTTLIDKMKQEVVMRKQQMEYYREKMMTFEEGENEWLEVSQIFDMRNGYTPSKACPQYWEGGTIPWFRMEDIREHGHILSDSLQHITIDGVKNGKLFKANSFILATTATIGEHALIIADSLANQQFTNLSIRKSLKDKLSVMFVYYYLFIVDEWCKNNINVSGFASLDMARFRRLRFPIPPLPEQRRIVSTLDTFEAYITKLERLIALRQKQYEYYRERLLTFD